ncbi:lipid II:glycine glycyltransferase (peptidoglycan interpeptide bridge formation enzyme) [Nocardioides thalensis]|uniref:Lipid II:glycine glycyltransferase (Peptidoglycan interpeptide bridge formation enzyme) n=1 Tax=Nocardioides thalensis TaxID=1914755 RepID=A0A853C973_9ACTN|nr:peptidoglycan bridge formation glycyltransferase FemA/FemB family protein [Nocardioides thalensis]NYJ03566.1 lipid II:glycine glycyltransferase (peptidoglycan interpeptide bridge formation enzyme) [Nocardioides thalensis]
MPSVRPITPTEHRDHLASLPSASFLQTPGWAQVKSEWRSESLGWFDDSGKQRGAALVLYRKLPKLNRFLAYLPEGPVIDWDSDCLRDWLDPMVAHLKRQGAFAVRIGPPVVTRRWTAAQVKEGVADPDVKLLGQVPPEERSAAGARVVAQLHDLGWRHQAAEGGFAAGQPQYVFQVPLRHPDGTARTEDEVLKGMNQLWRRNIKKAAKEGVEVSAGTRDDLKAFHDLYVHTAERDHFTPRPLPYFEVMWDALNADAPDRLKLWLGRHQGDLVAATLAVRVGEHYWYSYGASSTEKREVRGSNAVQWAMIQDALASGCAVYDLRGITDTLDSDDSHVGLIQFKVGTGGEAVEYAGEWDLPINRALYKAFQIYLARR